MSIKLYNTLTRKKEVFTPIDEQNVRLYVCGPTVYDFAHIGNARPVIVFDTLYRLLRHTYGEAHVTYVRNITDVDDKINNRATQDYPNEPLNEAIRKVTEKTEAQFQNDMDALGNLRPTKQPRATEYIDEMRQMIDGLVENGHAYVSEGHVLFHTPSMKDYGELSRRTLDELRAGARVEVAGYKKDESDFVLWKPSDDGQPGWPSPAGIQGLGRPGWHIECSAMSWKLLGENFDIHGGGIDLVFPHHENEIAQSKCFHGKDEMANIWMHNGFLQINGEKMSKSTGNFFTVNQVLETGAMGERPWHGAVARLAMLMTHYRHPIDFSIAKLEEAEGTLKSWVEAANVELDNGELDNISPSQEIIDALFDDLNLAPAFAYLHGLKNKAAKGDEETKIQLHCDLEFLGLWPKDVQAFLSAGNLELDASRVAEIEGLVAQRLAHLNAKEWGEADAIRNQLADEGIQLKDGKDDDGNRTTNYELKS
jgi:cysteinyl-tRNA synthetase